jgi:hypothetical protein
MICQGNDAFGSGERRVTAKIARAEQSIAARLADLRRELALIRWMLAGVFVAAIGGSIPFVMPLIS